jgi:hypothetical protein
MRYSLGEEERCESYGTGDGQAVAEVGIRPGEEDNSLVEEAGRNLVAGAGRSSWAKKHN